MADDLPGRTTMRYGTTFSCIAGGHVVEYVFHCFAMRQGARPRFSVSLRLSSLALVGVQ